MRYNSNQILFLLIGSLSLYKGGFMYFNPSYKSSKFGALDFGEHHTLVSGAFILFGLFAIYSVIRSKK